MAPCILLILWYQLTCIACWYEFAKLIHSFCLRTPAMGDISILTVVWARKRIPRSLTKRNTCLLVIPVSKRRQNRFISVGIHLGDFRNKSKLPEKLVTVATLFESHRSLYNADLAL